MKQNIFKKFMSAVISAVVVGAFAVPVCAEQKFDISTTKFTADESFDVKSSHSGASEISEKNVTAYIDCGIDLSNYVEEAAKNYSWTTSDSSVATVTDRGTVTGKKKGSVTITAYPYNENMEYRFYVTVKSGTEKSIKDIKIYVDETVNILNYLDGSASDYEWRSTDTSVADVSDRGILKGEKRGYASVYVYESGLTSGANYIFNVTVMNKSESYSSSSKTIDEKFTIYMGTKDVVNITDYLAKSAGSYDWESSDREVCRVTGGKLKAVGVGSAEVTAYGSKNYRFNVKVSKNYSNYDVTVKKDGTLDLDKYLDDSVSRYDISYCKSGIAKVKNGELVGIKKGSTYIIFDNGRSNEVVQLMVEVSGTTVNVSEKNTETSSQKSGDKAPSFTDISHRQWAAAAINNMAAKGYISGRNSYTFAPDDNCSKADFTIVLTKMLGIENDAYAGGFDDVTSDKYYAKYVNVARYHGICAGVKNNRFKPQNAITREEVMYMVYKGLELKGRKLDTDTTALGAYKDSSKINSEYKTAVAALLNEGIVSGVSDNEIDPTATITRAQMAVLLNNLGM